jgi:hypothetical protein
MTGDEWFGILFGIAAVATAIFRPAQWQARVFLCGIGVYMLVLAVTHWQWLARASLILAVPMIVMMIGSTARALRQDLTSRPQSPAKRRRAVLRRRQRQQRAYEKRKQADRLLAGTLEGPPPNQGRRTGPTL